MSGTSSPARPRGFSLVRLWLRLIDALEPVIEWTIRICGWSAILFVLAIFAFVFREAVPVLVGHEGFSLWEFFTSANWRPDSAIKPQYGIVALLAGSGAVTLISMLLAVPLGLGSAVFISEFCGGRVKETLKIVIELLAAIPSIVWGFIGVVVLGPLIISATGRRSE